MKKIIVLLIIITTVIVNAKIVSASNSLFPAKIEILSASTSNIQRDNFEKYFPFINDIGTVGINTFFSSNNIVQVYSIDQSHYYSCPQDCNAPNPVLIEHTSFSVNNNYKKINCDSPNYLSCFTSLSNPSGKEGKRSMILFVKDINSNGLIISSNDAEVDNLMKYISDFPYDYNQIGLTTNTPRQITNSLPIEYEKNKLSEFRKLKNNTFDFSYYIDRTPPDYINNLETPVPSDGMIKFNRNFPTYSQGVETDFVNFSDTFRIRVRAERYQVGNVFESSISQNNFVNFYLINENQNCIQIEPDKIVDGLIVKFGQKCEFTFETKVNAPRILLNGYYLYYENKSTPSFTSVDLSGNTGFGSRSQYGGGYSNTNLAIGPNVFFGELENNQIFRFWSSQNKGHFYTTSGLERDMIRKQYSTFEWQYEGVAYSSADCNDPASSNVYRFWSAQNNHHFYTNSPSEQDQVINQYSDNEWLYEGPAFCAYAFGGSDKIPVYRFWSEQNHVHFYTASEQEKNETIAKSTTKEWKLEGIVYYVKK